MRFINLGIVDYNSSYNLQLEYLNKKFKNEIEDDVLLLLEHYPVITLGRHAHIENILMTEDFLRQQNIDVINVDRGGDVTVHYPGQLVGYPIIDLNKDRDIHKYIRNIELLIIEFLKEYNINSCTKPGFTGVWVDDITKICSIGIGVKHWITYHGFALNVNKSQINYFNFINSCGLKNIKMISMEEILNRKLNIEEIKIKILKLFNNFFKYTENDKIKKTNKISFTNENKNTQIPYWVKKRISYNSKIDVMFKLLKKNRINTVCESANCPNIIECFNISKLTFMILGNICTRNCRFCSVKKGKPQPVDSDEPKRVAEFVEKLNLKHVIITSVTRDDLEDFGVSQFINTINEIRKISKEILIEVLIPDFNGDKKLIKELLNSNPDIIAHNIETVPSLYFSIRQKANYFQSLNVLKTVKDYSEKTYTKSGLMLGLGETEKEVIEVLNDLKKVKCDIITIGQYLKSDKNCVSVQKFISDEKFKEYETIAKNIGFHYVYSGRFVRSSYV